MLCQHCHKNEATTHVKTNVNGKLSEYDLCSQCARELGYTNMMSDFSTDLGSLFGSFFSTALPARTSAARCPQCGSSYHDIAKSGKVGCARCYDIFFTQLLPTVRSVHGSAEHIGKRPNVFANPDNSVKENTDDRQSRKEKLTAELNEAIKAQNFERAAELRDEINGLG